MEVEFTNNAILADSVKVMIRVSGFIKQTPLFNWFWAENVIHIHIPEFHCILDVKDIIS